MTKLRPDLQALVDAELARQRADSEANERLWGHVKAETPTTHHPTRSVEPYFVPFESPLYDAINVHLALRARTGYRLNPVARGLPWPEHVPFPYERVVPPEVMHQKAEQFFAETPQGSKERDLVAKMWSDMPWVVASNYGGTIDYPGGGMIVKKGSNSLVAYGFGELRDVRKTSPYDSTGKVDIDGETFYAKQGQEVYFEYTGKVYSAPTLEITGKVRKR